MYQEKDGWKASESPRVVSRFLNGRKDLNLVRIPMLRGKEAETVGISPSVVVVVITKKKKEWYCVPFSSLESRSVVWYLTSIIIILFCQTW